MKIILAPVDLKKGMYVAELDRPWLESPFLFQGFRITNSDEIKQISSLCAYVFVDTEKSTIPVQSQRATDNGDKTRNIEQDTSRYIKPAEPYNNNFEDEFPVAENIHENAQNMAGELFKDVRMGKSVDVVETRQVVSKMVASILRNPDALVLLTAMSNKNDSLAAHAMAVCTLSLTFGRYIGLDKATLEDLGMGALIHDIGETKLPDRLLTNNVDLSNEDRAQLQTHTNIGAMIVKQLLGVSERVIAIVRDHHERADGSGYPRNVSNSDLDICTRIVSIVDTYVSITSGAHSRERISLDMALKHIYTWRNGLFDSVLVESFIQCIGIYPIGSTVELHSGHIGIVISSQPDARLFPKLLLILDADGKQLEPPKTINLALFRDKGEEGNGYEVKRLVNPEAYNIDVRNFILRELSRA